MPPNFTWNQFMQNLNFKISHFYNFGGSELWILVTLGLESCSNLQNQNSERPNMTFLDRLNLPKFDFMQIRSGVKIIKFLDFPHFTQFLHIMKILLPLRFYVKSIFAIPEVQKIAILINLRLRNLIFAIFESWNLLKNKIQNLWVGKKVSFLNI